MSSLGPSQSELQLTAVVRKCWELLEVLSVAGEHLDASLYRALYLQSEGVMIRAEAERSRLESARVWEGELEEVDD